MDRRTVTIMGKQVAYWEHGHHWPQTIVLLHGFRGNHRGLLDMARHLKGYRLILPDLPGYGESEALDAPHTLQNYAKWLDLFVAKLELHDYVCWSHSYSGSIALIHAAQGHHKPTALVSVSLAAVRRDWPSFLSTLYYRLGQRLPKGLQHRWIASRMIDHATGRWLFMTVSTARRRFLQKRGDQNLPLMNALVVTEEYLSALDTDLDWYARRVSIPVLVVAGARDIIVPVKRLERLVNLLDRSRLEVMPDQGHLAPIERPGATATITKNFLRELEQSRRR
jgi:pimeloyl-ACP methyl ester carboxylesterase